MQIYKVYNQEKNEYPIIVNLPHSGTIIPKEIEEQFIEPKPIIANNDWFLNELYDFLVEMNVTILSANFSRYIVDVNRVITEPLVGENYNKCTIYGKTIWGNELYKEIPNEIECEKRLNTYYYPYHEKLNELINEKFKKFDKVLILDLHSGASSTGEKDICLGNANNEMSSLKTIEQLKKCLQNVGYSVNLNVPMTGGQVLRKYNSDNKNIECILFELNFNQYIENRYIGEEEINKYNKVLFEQSKSKLKKALKDYLLYLKNNFN